MPVAAELAAAEKERLLTYDKTKLSQHSALFAFAAKARKALEDAAEKNKGKDTLADAVKKVADGQLKALQGRARPSRRSIPRAVTRTS